MKEYRKLHLSSGEVFTFYVNSGFTEIAEHLAIGNMPVGWEYDDLAAYDREFQLQVARYDTVQHDDDVTLVTEDGKVIGALDAPVPAEYGIKAEKSDAA